MQHGPLPCPYLWRLHHFRPGCTTATGSLMPVAFMTVIIGWLRGRGPLEPSSAITTSYPRNLKAAACQHERTGRETQGPHPDHREEVAPKQSLVCLGPGVAFGLTGGCRPTRNSEGFGVGGAGTAVGRDDRETPASFNTSFFAAPAAPRVEAVWALTGPKMAAAFGRVESPILSMCPPGSCTGAGCGKKMAFGAGGASPLLPWAAGFFFFLECWQGSRSRCEVSSAPVCCEHLHREQRQ